MIEQQNSTVPSENHQYSNGEEQEMKINNILKELHVKILQDISIKKGRRQKYTIHKQSMEKISANIHKMDQNYQKSIFEKQAIIYYDLAKLGDKQESLQKAISILQNQEINKYVIVRWKMQLVAMKSSSNKNEQAFLLAVEASQLILLYLESINADQNTNPNLGRFLTQVIQVIKSQQKNDFIWIHNSQNNMRYFKANLVAQLQPLSQEYQQLTQPFFTDYDFHIADYMSLQILDLKFIQEKNEQSMQEVVRQLVIFCSIGFFTRATQKYYLKDYSNKQFHFKAIQICLLGFQQTSTYMMFLTKVLIDHFGSKSSEICQQNSQIIEYNQLRRKLPGDKKQVKMVDIVFADE